MIGLPLAVLTFEQAYKAATPVSANDHWKMVKLPISLPYTASWENPDGSDGLVQDGNEFYNIVHQHYANDTLYTLLKTNQNAKERFDSLADQLQQLDDEDSSPGTPGGRLLKLLKDRLTTYLPPLTYQLSQPSASTQPAGKAYPDAVAQAYQIDRSPTSPPPQI